jgi:pSer/pThr/pTyr-binding forkhead associated (FHA) protein
MNAIAHIIVQLVHIEGPLKGKIQEFSDPEIVIGRHPTCQVQFPKEMVTLSRNHARILREGNRFKLIDESTNGTFVNGQRLPEAYLKSGDVLTFTEGGPKISFLTEIRDQPSSIPPPVPAEPTPGRTFLQAEPRVKPDPTPPVAAPVSPPASPGPSRAASPAPLPGPEIRNVKVPFAIQYGPMLKSFRDLPITLGKGTSCDFVINHPAMNDRQAQIFFSRDQYWIKDLSGTNSVTIDGTPIYGEAALQADMRIGLSPRGPTFRFLSGGRLAEVEEPLPAPSEQASPPEPRSNPAPTPADPAGSKPASLFKKFFS